MSAIPFPIRNPKDAIQPVSAGADVQMEESETSPPSDTNGASVAPTHLRLGLSKDKVSKALGREQKNARVIRNIQANEIKRLKSEISTNREILQQFSESMEEMRRKLDEVQEAAADADARVLEVLRAKRTVEDAFVESEKRVAEALEAKERAEQKAADMDQKATMAAENARKVTEGLIFEKQQQAERLSELMQRLKEKDAEPPRPREDEVMEDTDVQKNIQAAAAALEDAKKREEIMINDMRKQEELVAALRQKLREKEEAEPSRPREDEVMEDADIQTNIQAAAAALEDAKRREEVMINNMRKQEELVAALRQQLREKEPPQPEDKRMEEEDVQQPLNDQSSVPKPMQPQRPTAGAGPSLAGTRRRKEPPLPPNLRTRTWDEIIENTEFDRNASSSAGPSLENLDAKLNMILQKVLPALQQGNHTPRPKRAGKDFKTPIRRVTNSDRTARNTWVRFQMNELIGIKKDEDIKDIDELILPNSTLNLGMAAFEKDARIAAPPTFRPMRPNLNNVNGRWNDRLFDHFLDHCRVKYPGNIGDDAEEELLEIFKERISSMRKVMMRYRPKEGESMTEAASRGGVTHLAGLARQRRNTRRNETFNTRFDTTSAYIRVDAPDAEWLDNNTAVSLLGCEGMSSDESDTDDSNRRIFKVKTMPWRNPILLAKLQSVDADRNRANVYGNSKGGTPPRTRKRKDGRPSSRKPPTGKPMNFYDPVWYEGLTAKQKKDLDAKPAVRLMDNMVVE